MSNPKNNEVFSIDCLSVTFSNFLNLPHLFFSIPFQYLNNSLKDIDNNASKLKTWSNNLLEDVYISEFLVAQNSFDSKFKVILEIF